MHPSFYSDRESGERWWEFGDRIQPLFGNSQPPEDSRFLMEVTAVEQ